MWLCSARGFGDRIKLGNADSRHNARRANGTGTDADLDGIRSSLNQGFGAFKPALAELLVETLRPISGRLAELERDTAELDRILASGAARARASAAPVLAGAYSALGLTRETR